MSGIGSSLVSPPRYRSMPPRPRSEGKRTRIIDAAMRHFAEQGYHAARVGDIAAALGIAKGSIFQHYGSKAGLFLATMACMNGGDLKALRLALTGAERGPARHDRSVAVRVARSRAPRCGCGPPRRGLAAVPWPPRDPRSPTRWRRCAGSRRRPRRRCARRRRRARQRPRAAARRRSPSGRRDGGKVLRNVRPRVGRDGRQGRTDDAGRRARQRSGAGRRRHIRS